MPNAPYIALLVGLIIHALLSITAIIRIRRCERRQLENTVLPGITVLKPLCGLDNELATNLESFFAAQYAPLQLIFAAVDPQDPALQIARQLAARYPSRDATILAGVVPIGTSLKVSLLEAMHSHARHDLLLISDSNVQTDDESLCCLVDTLRDERIGLAFQPLVGVDEHSVPAAIENLRLTDYCGLISTGLKTLVGIDAVTGKSLLVRREALADQGGWLPLRDVAGDDQLLVRGVSQAGWHVALAPRAARCVHTRWSWRELIDRHIRHSAIRLRLAPWAYALEPLGNPILIGIFLTLKTGLSGAAWLAMAAIVKTTIETLGIRCLRGQSLRVRYAILVPLKDLLMATIWLRPLISSRVSWRGSTFRIGPGSTLVEMTGRPHAIQNQILPPPRESRIPLASETTSAPQCAPLVPDPPMDPIRQRNYTAPHD